MAPSVGHFVKIMSSALVRQLTEVFVETLKNETFQKVMERMQIVSAGDGYCICELPVESQHRNEFGTMHGGLTATLVDTTTSLALHTKQRRGVSVQLNVSYLNPAQVGKDIIVDAKTVHVGRTLAFLTATILDKASGKLIATGNHIKYLK